MSGDACWAHDLYHVCDGLILGYDRNAWRVYKGSTSEWRPWVAHHSFGHRREHRYWVGTWAEAWRLAYIATYGTQAEFREAVDSMYARSL